MSKTQELAQLIDGNKIRKNVQKDKYGRTFTEYSYSRYDEAAKSESNKFGYVSTNIAVVVNLPKMAWDTSGKFLVNDWSIRGREGVSYYNDRLDAHLTAVRAVITAITK